MKRIKNPQQLQLYIYKRELEKACFAHDAVHSDIKDLAKRAIYDNNEVMNLLQILNTVNTKEDWQVWCIVFFDEKTGSGLNLNERSV